MSSFIIIEKSFCSHPILAMYLFLIHTMLHDPMQWPEASEVSFIDWLFMLCTQKRTSIPLSDKGPPSSIICSKTSIEPYLVMWLPSRVIASLRNELPGQNTVHTWCRIPIRDSNCLCAGLCACTGISHLSSLFLVRWGSWLIISILMPKIQCTCWGSAAKWIPISSWTNFTYFHTFIASDTWCLPPPLSCTIPVCYSHCSDCINIFCANWYLNVSTVSI